MSLGHFVFFTRKTVMDQRLQKAKDLILSHKDILVVLAARPDGDSLLATSALFLALKKLADDGPIFNLVDFLIPGKLSGIHKELVGDGILKYTKKELDARNYVINVPCGEGVIDKVSWRVENDLFKLFITPSYGDINIKDVEFEQVGSNYKLIILVGFSDLERLGDVYTKNKIFFDKAPKLAINGPSKGNFEMNLECDPSRSVSETILDLLKTLKVSLDAELAQLLLAGIIQKAGGHIENINSRETLDSISMLLDSGAQMDAVRKRNVGKGTFALLQLQQRVFANVRQDPAGVLWSKVNNFELRDLQIPDEEISVEDTIPFNMCEGYDHVFELFELADGTVIGRLESATFDVKNFDDTYSISGYEGVIIFETEKAIDVVESFLLNKLGVSSDEDVAKGAEIAKEPFLVKTGDAMAAEGLVGEAELKMKSAKVSDVLENEAKLDSTNSSQAKRDHGSQNKAKETVKIGKKKHVVKNVSGSEVVIPEPVTISENKTDTRSGLVQAEEIEEGEEFDNSPIISSSDDDNESFGPPKIFGSNRFGSFAGSGPSRFDGTRGGSK